jgi:RNA polymerase sigma factor (sigma-70 family)
VISAEREAVKDAARKLVMAHRPIETRPSADSERVKAMKELDQELLQIEPTSYALFRYDVLNQPKVNMWPKEQQDALIEQARAGDQEARELLLCSCLSFIFYRAWRYKDELRHDDPMDLVSIGNVAMLEALDKALYADNPIKYLISQGAYAIAHYVFHDSPMIKRDKHRNIVTPVTSLDAELGQTDLTYNDVLGMIDVVDLSSDVEDTQDKKYAALYQALDRLTEKQRYVVTRHLGLDDAPIPLAEVGREMAIRPESAWKQWKAAQKRLKKLLSKQYS